MREKRSPIKPQDVRQLTDEKYEKLAKGLLEHLKLSEDKEATWKDIEKVAQASVGNKPEKSSESQVYAE